jgi:hypothetical protein
LPAATQVYYRIVQVDENGKYEYSMIVSFANAQSQTMQLMPNPAIDQVTLTITAAENKKALIELSDMNGKSVRTYSTSLHAGNNSIHIGGLRPIPRGHYVLKVRTAKGVAYSKLILQ